MVTLAVVSVLTSLQEVPASVVSDQISTALKAEIGRSELLGGGGVPASVVLVLSVVLTLVVVLAWVRLRIRRGTGAKGAGLSEAEPASTWKEGARSPYRSPDPPETLALPPHLLAMLAKRAADRAEASQGRDPGEPDDGAAASEVSGNACPGGLDGLDIIIGG